MDIPLNITDIRICTDILYISVYPYTDIFKKIGSNHTFLHIITFNLVIAALNEQRKSGIAGLFLEIYPKSLSRHWQPR